MASSRHDPVMLGRGIYSIPEASRLTGVHANSLARWMGYRLGQESVWQGDYPRLDGRPALSFFDLQQARVIGLLRARGLTLQSIRRALHRATSEWATRHPFATLRLRTLGRSIFLEVGPVDAEVDVDLIELLPNQRAWKSILDPFLEDVEYDEDGKMSLWWPGLRVPGIGRAIEVSPGRSLGKPVVARCGIEAHILAADAESNVHVRNVAAWYGIAEADVAMAVAWKQHLQAQSAA